MTDHPVIKDNQPDWDAPVIAPMVQDKPAPTAAAPGKVRVEHKTLETWDDGQRGALQQANMERTARGNPHWIIADYVRCHPDKFPDVDFELDHNEHLERVKEVQLPPDEFRKDQRPVR